MSESIDRLLASLARERIDPRTDLLEVSVRAATGSHIELTGRVLDAEDLLRLKEILQAQLPGFTFDLRGVLALRQAAIVMTVATHLTGLYTAPSWQAELQSEMLFGWQVEVLEEQGDWCRVRQMDGYLGWAYRPFLRRQPSPFPTHLVTAPVGLLHREARTSAAIEGRVLGGTAVQISAQQPGWLWVNAHVSGWMPATDLRTLDSLPMLPEERRGMMMHDAARMVGVPYLWGGCTAHGIDCSGLAQLLHAWVGVPIPRDADMQYTAGQPVQPPFQPGDLLYFGDSQEARSITHVAISTGGWQMIHSSRPINGVGYGDVQKDAYLRSHFVGARCFLD